MGRKEKKIEKNKAAGILEGMKKIEQLLGVDSKTMSEILGISYGHYRNIVNYKYPLSPYMVVKMADYAKVSVTRILEQLTFEVSGKQWYLVPMFVEGYLKRSYYEAMMDYYTPEVEELYESLLDTVPKTIVSKEKIDVKVVIVFGTNLLKDNIRIYLENGYDLSAMTSTAHDCKDTEYTLVFVKKDSDTA